MRSGKMKRGDFVLTTRGTVGNIAYYGDDMSYDNVRINSGMVILRPQKDVINEKFFHLFLISQNFRNQIEAIKSGSAQPQLPIRDLKLFEINLPSIDRQKNIAQTLFPINDKIELNNKISKNLEAMAQAIFKEWFIEFNFPVELVKSEKLKVKSKGYKDAGGKMVDSELGKIPEEWRVGKLGEIVNLIRERVRNYKEWQNEKLLDLGRFPTKSLAMVSFGKGGEMTTSVFRFRKFDILFGAIRPYFHKVLIAPFNGVTNSSVFVIHPKQDIFWSFLVTILFSERTISYATQCSSGTKMPVVKWEDLCDMPIIIPDIAIVKSFDNKVGSFYKKIIKLVEENQTLSSLRDLLLPKLMSGEIRI